MNCSVSLFYEDTPSTLKILLLLQTSVKVNYYPLKQVVFSRNVYKYSDKDNPTNQTRHSAIIGRMKNLQRVLIFLLAVLPMGLGVLVPTVPEAFASLAASEIAKAAEKSGDRFTEISALETIVAYQPWRFTEWEQIGDLQFATGDYPGSIQSFTKAAALGNLSAESLLDEGSSWNSLGDKEAAKSAFREASGAGSVDIKFYSELAKIQESLDDSIGTLATLLHAHELAPNYNDINYDLGVQFTASQPDNAVMFLDKSKTDSAYSTYAEALLETISETEQLGESAERYIYIGQELSQIGEWQAAASAFGKATSIDAGNGIAWALLGEAVQHVGGDGFDDLSKALELVPQSDIVNGLMAIYYRRQQKYDLAISYLYKAEEYNPNESTWQIEIGNTLALKGDLSNALVHLQDATLLEPDSWVPWQSLATFCISYNYYVSTTGIEAARKALLLVPGSPVLLDIMGSAYMVTGDLDSAERLFLQALDAAPNQAEILYHLGQLYLLEQNKDLAFSYLRAAAKNATDARIRDNANLLIQQNGGG